MKNMMVIAVILACACSAGGDALSASGEKFKVNLTNSLSGAGNLPGLPALPVEYRQFVVTAGRFDSVSVSKTGPTAASQSSLAFESSPVTTFAGDADKPADYYSTLLGDYLSRQAELNPPVTVVARSMVGERQLLTIAVHPVDVNPNTGAWTRYTNIDLTFHGSADLQVEPLVDKYELAELLRANASPTLKRVAARSTGALGAEYLVVTGSNLEETFAPLLKWKSMKGLQVGIATIEDVVLQNDGVDDAEKLRNFLIASYQAGTRYVLLGGDETVIPIRYAFYANTDAQPSLDLLQICDLYYGDVDGRWDVDGDGIYGEPSQDSADVYNELLVGRLPMSTAEEIGNYVTKLIQYEQNPNGGNYDYLNKALFVAADQMRDYQSGMGQHELLAQGLPATVNSDLTDLVEAPSGIAGNPTSPTAPSAIAKLAEGWGMISLLIHGVSDGWVVRSNLYNQWPKSYLFAFNGTDDTHGFLPNVAANTMPGFVYSIGCNNGAFDMDAPPFPSSSPSVAQWFLARPGGGAVGFIGYSRWGWVATSWHLEQSFLDYLYNVNNNPAEALRYSKQQFPYYRDICYGLNYYGDPEMRIWIKSPETVAVSLPQTIVTGDSNVDIVIATGSTPLDGMLVSLTKNDTTIAQAVSDADGRVQLAINFNYDDRFAVTAFKEGYATETKTLTPQIVLGNDDNDVTLPYAFQLHQNYPNPFNPTTRIAFDLGQTADVSLSILNILGQRVRTITRDRLLAGRHEAFWDGSGDDGVMLGSGIYFARLETDEHSAIIKMALLK
jgi:hypothetical protein